MAAVTASFEFTGLNQIQKTVAVGNQSLTVRNPVTGIAVGTVTLNPQGAIIGQNLNAGYAVSIVKAGATIVGKSAGPVRPPISDLKPQEVEELAALIRKLGPQ